MRNAIALIAICGALTLTTVQAQTNPKWLGTNKSGFTHGNAPKPNFSIPPTFSYTGASYGTGGVALRNRIKGDINISGVTGSTQAAWLYWAVLFGSTPTAAQLKKASEVTLQREFPLGAPTGGQVTGTVIGVGIDPCWGSAGSWVFRAPVSTAVATGNGIYRVILPPVDTGLSDGEDPWDGNVVYPLAEGASLVIVGTGTQTVGLYDGFAAVVWFGGDTVNLAYQLPAPVTLQALLDNIGFDGQIGDSRSPGTSNETTTATGSPSGTVYAVAGPGGSVTNSDWDGSSGWPLPQLWDDTGHDITPAIAASDTAVTVTYTSVEDCLGEVAAVISAQ